MMPHNLIKKVGGNFSWLIFGQFVYKLLSFFALVVLARKVGVEQFGVFSYSLAFVGLFYALPDFGLSDFFVRNTAKDHNLIDIYLGNFLTAKLILAVITSIVFGIISIMHFYNKTVAILIIIFGLGIILESMNFLMKAVFQSYEKMKYEAFSLASEGIMRFLLVVWLLHKGFGIIAVAFAFFISTLFGLFLSIILVRYNFVKFSFRYDKEFIVKSIFSALPFAGLYLLGYINLKIDVVMLFYMLGEKATGLFGAANRLVEPLLAIPIMMGISLAPPLSSASKWGRTSISFFVKKSALMLIILYIPFAIICIVFAPSIFENVFSISYINATGIFRILIWFFPIFCIQIKLEKLINGLGREWVTVALYLAGTFLNIILNIVLIPRFNVSGAAIATVISQGVILLGLVLFLSLTYSKSLITDLK